MEYARRDAVGGPRPFRWTRETGVVDLGVPSGADPAYRVHASLVSKDGTAVVGHVAQADGIMIFRWTEATGMQDITPPDSVDTIWPSFVSDDGTVVAGNYERAEGSAAFLWSAGRGHIDLGAFGGYSDLLPAWLSAAAACSSET